MEKTEKTAQNAATSAKNGANTVSVPAKYGAKAAADAAGSVQNAAPVRGGAKPAAPVQNGEQLSASPAQSAGEGREEVLGALYRRAVGCSADEVVEEYAVGEDGSQQLVKRRVKKRELPPDMAAVRLLLEAEKTLASLTDEELAAEKRRLLRLLQKTERAAGAQEEKE